MDKNRAPVSIWLVILIILLVTGMLALVFLLMSLFVNSNPLPQVENNLRLDSPTISDTLLAALTITPASTLTQTPTITPTLTYNHTSAPTQTSTQVPTLTAAPDTWIEEQLARMTIEQKVGQMVMAGVNGSGENSSTCKFVQQLQPGAIVLVKSNVSTPDQLSAFNNSLQNCAQAGKDLPLLIAVDHEGQYVNRFDRGVTLFPAAMAVGATGDTSQAFKIAFASGQELAFSGVNMVLGPVADVLTNYDNTVISQRSFGGDPQTVAGFVSQAVKGYQQADLIPVLKHFPGHGGTTQDSHDVLPVDNISLDDLKASYLLPFQAGIAAGAQVVMVSHVAFPSIDASGKPSSLSGPVVSLLRQDLGFQGMVLTDSLGMGAITGQGLSIPDASVQAVSAGVDMLLVSDPGQALATQKRLLKAIQSGEIDQNRIDDAIRHILTLKSGAGLKDFQVKIHTAPDWKADQTLANDAGGNSVTLVRNQAGLIPLPGQLKNILLIGPPDGWGLYPILLPRLKDSGFNVKLVTYSAPWAGVVQGQSYLKSLPAQASRYNLVIVLTWEAHANHLKNQDEWQINLVKNLIATTVPTIVVALKSPTDILEFPDVNTYLATYGTTRGQSGALADILVGLRPAIGVNPLPNLH